MKVGIKINKHEVVIKYKFQNFLKYFHYNCAKNVVKLQKKRY